MKLVGSKFVGASLVAGKQPSKIYTSSTENTIPLHEENLLCNEENQ